jgi:ATP-dependent Clp protease adapter protein ClpS
MTEVEHEINTASIIGTPYKVILFNDDDHDMLQVTNQISKAISCDDTKAYLIMLEAHKNGRAIVYTGSREKCEHVETILAEIRLGTKIEPA